MNKSFNKNEQEPRKKKKIKEEVGNRDRKSGTDKEKVRERRGIREMKEKRMEELERDM